MSAARKFLPALFAATAMSVPADAETTDPMAAGRAAWARRAEGHQGPRADPGPIREAVAAFESALEAEPENLAARVGLIKALYYLGEHAIQGRDEKLVCFERGRRLAEDGIDQLAAGYAGDPRPNLRSGPVPPRLVDHLAGTPEARGIYLWGSIQWGLWGRHRGKIAAARQGVAGKIRDYATVAVALDEQYENAGGHRVLGRLHAEAPKLPFITGWIDRDLAIRSLERAVALAPDDLLSELYLIEALLEYDGSRRPEAVDRLRLLVTQTPNPDYLVEELQALADGQKLLASLGAHS